MLKSYRWATFVLLAMGAACSDATSPPKPTGGGDLDLLVPAPKVPLPAHKYVQVGNQAAPVGYESWGETDAQVSVDVGFVNGTTAYAQGILYYYATDATITLDLYVYGGTVSVPSAHARESRSNLLFPSRGSIMAQATTLAPAACGYMAQGTATGSASFKVLSSSKWVSWGEKTGTTTGTAIQPECPTGGGSSGGGSSGGGTLVTTCWYTDVFAPDGTYVYTYTNECSTTYYADTGSGSQNAT